MSTTIRINDFLVISRRYVTSSIARANADASTMLTAREAAALPKDLRDNFAAFGQERVNWTRFRNEAMGRFERTARVADTNGDGFLSASERKRLPADVRDNFENCARALAKGSQVHDKTPSARVKEAEARYPGAISYGAAFAMAASAVLSDTSPASPRALLRAAAEAGGRTLTETQLTAELKRRLKGLEMLAPGQEGGSLPEPATHWIFGVDLDVGTAHSFWVTVDRRTSETSVTGID